MKVLSERKKIYWVVGIFTMIMFVLMCLPTKSERDYSTAVYRLEKYLGDLTEIKIHQALYNEGTMYIILTSNNIEELTPYTSVSLAMYGYEGEDSGSLAIVNSTFGYITTNRYYNDGIRIPNWLLTKSINPRIFIAAGLAIISMSATHVYIQKKNKNNNINDVENKR
jgi:hypothetical protein